MLHTTFKKLHEAHACKDRYKIFAKMMGDINKYGESTPIPLGVVLDKMGLEDTIWTLRATIELAENIIIEFACRCAEHVLINYEKLYPDDNRPRKAIETARNCITDKSEAARAAARAARAAAWAAAWAAAEAGTEAAWAARAAEREWQVKQLEEILEGL